jgi:protease I
MQTYVMGEFDLNDLEGVRIATIIAEGFDERVCFGVSEPLAVAGAIVSVLSRQSLFAGALPADFDALLLPGGEQAVSELSDDPYVLKFVQEIQSAWKPIGAIGFAPVLLVFAGLVPGRILTSAYPLRQTIENCGGTWVNGDAIVDYNWLTSRGPRDLPAFNRTFPGLLKNAKAIFRNKEPLISPEMRAIIAKARIA